MNRDKNAFKEQFGIDVFNDKARKEYLSKEAYEALEKAVENRKELNPLYADEVAKGMLNWALSKGATHYTHWFQPLNGKTAEKHDAFVGKPNEKGEIEYDFQGNELIKGEPDASSFPSGGLRATFEARGYTVWDPASPAFVLSDEEGAVLYIPTAFCSFNGEALDGKTPLLRSEDYLNEAVIRLLPLIGLEAPKRVYSYAGAEQEYFLLETEDFLKRKDLVYTGRTLFGAAAPKGQELDDHYFGPIREKISSYMKEVNDALWKLGIPAKTEHNEVAPSQHELACIYAPSSLTADQNQLVMRLLKRIAKHHGMICLLGEKPFEGINGSGKHNNWSVGTSEGLNLFSPGKEPEKNLRFLVFLSAVLKGVDEHADLLRESVASYGNDFRLGANEAPPAILSVYLGENLYGILKSLLDNKAYSSKKEKATLSTSRRLPSFQKDDADRNRTSPFAFTGNRFEFRMVGSEQNIAEPNTYLNVILGSVLNELSDILEKASNKEKAAWDWVKKTVKEHERIIFNGNGYSKEWELEAKKRGLANLKTTPEAIESLNRKENRELLTRSGILSEMEIESRIAIKYQDYHSKAIIEAKTMSRMAHKLYLPSIHEALKERLEERQLLGESFEPLEKIMACLMKTLEETCKALDKLDALLLSDSKEKRNEKEKAFFASVSLKEAMAELRAPIDRAELLVPKRLWPVPTYGDLLFHI